MKVFASSGPSFLTSLTKSETVRFSKPPKDGTKSIKKVADPDKVKSAYKEDGWNDLVVIAKGPTVIQKINGVVFSQLTDHDEKYSTSKGWIALQDHGKGTNVEFRNIRIRIDK